MELAEDFFILQHDRIRHAKEEIPVKQILKNDVVRTVSEKRFDKDIRVNNDFQGFAAS